MKILFLFWIIAFTANAFAFDSSSVNWADVKSEVRWLNFYSEPSLLTLTIDGFEGLKKLKPGGYFPPTKFPPGDFGGGIKDGRSKKEIEKFAFTVQNGERYVVFSAGNDETGSKTFIIQEKKPSAGKSQIRVFNMCPDSILEWNRADGTKVLKLKCLESAEISFETVKEHKSRATLVKNGKRSEIGIVNPSSEDSSWLYFVHLDGIDFQTVRMTILREGDNFYSGPEDQASSSQ